MPLLGLILLVIGAQLAAIYVPFLQDFLRISPLALSDLLLCFGISALVFVYSEIEKIFLRRNELPLSR
jgi:Ca2+-transporting ATPase